MLCYLAPLYWPSICLERRFAIKDTWMSLDTKAFRIHFRHAARSHKRHSAITAALEATNGNIAEVMKFSRHKDPKVLMKYDDNRKDVAGDIANRIDLGR